MTVSTAGPDSLLSAPLTAGVRAEGRFPRPNTETLGYENTGQQFRITNSSKNYNSQFYKVTVTAFLLLSSSYSELSLAMSGLQCQIGGHETSGHRGCER